MSFVRSFLPVFLLAGFVFGLDSPVPFVKKSVTGSSGLPGWYSSPARVGEPAFGFSYWNVPEVYDRWAMSAAGEWGSRLYRVAFFYSYSEMDSLFREHYGELDGAYDVTVSVDKESGAEAALLVEGKIGNSSFSQKIVLEAASKRLEFRTTVDWKELHRLLKVGFPVSVYTDNVINEMQFGYVERPVHRSRLYDKDRFEVCNHRYSALTDGSHGAAVLNDCKYGMSANGNRLELTLLTASACPEMRADNHVHHFTYAFCAFEGPFSQSDVVRQGLDLNVPVLVEKGSRKAFSAFSVSGDSVLIDTVKPAEDGSKDLVLRLYDSKKCAGRYDVRIDLPVKTAKLVNVLEETLEDLPLEKTETGYKLSLDFHDFEIKSVRLSF